VLREEIFFGPAHKAISNIFLFVLTRHDEFTLPEKTQSIAVDIFTHKCDTNNICKFSCRIREHNLSITNINRAEFQATAVL